MGSNLMGDNFPVFGAPPCCRIQPTHQPECRLIAKQMRINGDRIRDELGAIRKVSGKWLRSYEETGKNR